MGNLKRAVLVICALVIQFSAMAQDKVVKSEPEGFMRSNGKIYVVVAVVLTILAGLIIYMVRLDRKLSKLEKEHR
jgi:hypothetical protein